MRKNGWYWCVWVMPEDEEQYFMVPMLWQDYEWKLPHGTLRLDTTTPYREPNYVYGPIEVPNVRRFM